jgi:hypothetical protein
VTYSRLTSDELPEKDAGYSLSKGVFV